MDNGGGVHILSLLAVSLKSDAAAQRQDGSFDVFQDVHRNARAAAHNRWSDRERGAMRGGLCMCRVTNEGRWMRSGQRRRREYAECSDQTGG